MKTAKEIAEAANGGTPLEVVIDHFRVKQKQDYAFKKNYARVRAWEFYEHEEIAGNAYVAVGGLDSITLFVFLRSIGIDVPGISVSSLEDKSIQKVHKALGIKSLPAARKPDGKLMTTGAQRTGCSLCCFGIHMEKRPHRFDRLRERNPKEWAFWMYEMGIGAVLDYIGVPWESRADGQPEGQMNMDEMLEEDKV